MIYDDPRRFGRIEYGAEPPPRVSTLGPEPLEISLAGFTKRIKERQGPIQAVLLNQTVVRAVGKIYAAGRECIPNGSRLH